MASFYFERALFVVGEQDSGKSTQLRSMFRDIRLRIDGTPASTVPESPNLPEMYRLSNERSLYIRISSPHEKGETLRAFLRKTEDKMAARTPSEGRRWNFACAIQPFAANKMPDLPQAIDRFVARFVPERTRIAFLSPDHYGTQLQPAHDPLIAPLRIIPSVEACWIDARDRTASGLLLADFFDFT